MQRFFQFVQLDHAVAARLVVQMLNLERPKYLAFDRINWKLGSRDINILAIVTRRFRCGCCSTCCRIRAIPTSAAALLMRRYLRLLPAASIRCLLADVSSLGPKWMISSTKTMPPLLPA
ncbi:hypothetical protein EH240_31775 [Mesorhizobium tamadayense]|uniref:Uncharacterized protein n=1 Tax=Mesorhizobium tamadayense TaxID=425306 RepID=A0A3P3EZV1_9HYPH|nr:hypothetical protein [Mesorhizobium tamadayense]RRH91919.1 hypothetical protein EH240_31775 [Mesorhizobium tamadayense]